MSGLTDEQRWKIEENKRKALAKRAEKLKRISPPKPPTHALTSVSSGKDGTSCLPAVRPYPNVNTNVQQDYSTKTTVSNPRLLGTYTDSSAAAPPNRVKPSGTSFSGDSVSGCSSTPRVDNACKPEKSLAEQIEENRKKALAKRAEKFTVSPPKQQQLSSLTSAPGSSNINTDVGLANKGLHNIAHSTSGVGANSAASRNSSDKVNSCALTTGTKTTKCDKKNPSAGSGQISAVPISSGNKTVFNTIGTSVKTTRTNQNVFSASDTQNQPSHNTGKPTINIGQNIPPFRTSSSSTNTGTSMGSGVVGAHGEAMSASSGNKNMFTSSSFGGKPMKGSCVLVTRERFQVDIGYCAPLVQLFKTLETKLYDAVTKNWSLKLSDYHRFMAAAKVLTPNVDIEPLPKAILQAFAAQIKGENSNKDIPIADLSRVPSVLVNSLMAFQREGVNFSIHKKGRILIADDMGLGKTIQAIAIACHYRDEWPMLIVVPSSVRFDWAQQLQRWVPSLDPQEIRVVVSGKESCTSGLVNILSYDIMTRKADTLRCQKFQLVIMDECHMLKNYKTARCKAAMPLLQNARRVILLSGTPALSRPSELYTQISAVCPFFFKYHDFGVRYCDGRQQNWGWDYSGSSHMGELQLLLEEKIMIRRLKCDVLSQLPDKVRQMVLLDPSSIKIGRGLQQASKVVEKLKGIKQRGALLEFFHQSGNAKVNAIKSYIDDLLEGEKKILIFAHHQEVLDAIEELVRNKIGTSYMRIDGRTSSEQRNLSCRKFQYNDDMRVAILSITAANAGLNLSAANLVVFTELFWNPGILVQAEDRAHRIGQLDSVIVQYLVAKGTSDDHVWPMIQKKLDVLGKAGLSKENFSSADTTKFIDQRQEEITRFMEESFADDFDSFIEPKTEDSGEVDFDPQAQKKRPAKQTSILKYVSPQKDMPSPPSTPPSTPPKGIIKQPEGLLKYFSPTKKNQQTDEKTTNFQRGSSARFNHSKQDSAGHSSDVNGQGYNSAGQSCYDDDLEAFLASDEDFGDIGEPETKKRRV